MSKVELQNARYIIDLTYNLLFAKKFADIFPNKIIVFLWEPPIARPVLWEPKFHQKLAKLFTWDDSLVDNKKYFKANYVVFKGYVLGNIVPFVERRKLCCLFSTNKRSNPALRRVKALFKEREAVVKFFENLKEDDFDLYGRGWSRGEFKSYRGYVSNKIATLKDYKFCICYENMRDVSGYITEKIFDCFIAGVVPIYWGASNIEDYIPSNCFIDRRKFRTIRELYLFLKNMRAETYNKYLVAIKQYAESVRSHEFTFQCLYNRVLHGIMCEW